MSARGVELQTERKRDRARDAADWVAALTTRERVEHRKVEVTERLAQRDDAVGGEAREPRDWRAGTEAPSRLRRRPD